MEQFIKQHRRSLGNKSRARQETPVDTKEWDAGGDAAEARANADRRRTFNALRKTVAPTMTDEDAEKHWAEIERKRAVDNARQWMDQAIAGAERLVEELKRHRASFDKSVAENDPEGPRPIMLPRDHVSSFVNTVMWAAPNWRMDMAANVANDLAHTDPRSKR